MTDYGTLNRMLTRAGIAFKREDNSDEVDDLKNPVINPGGKVKADFVVSVERGYSGFVTTFWFDDAGNLLDMGAYE